MEMKWKDKTLFEEIMTKNFPNLMKNITMSIREVEQNQVMQIQGITCRQIKVKMIKIKDKVS
jgi:hypothetical protein